MSNQHTYEAYCSKTESMLSEYVDNTLSARDTWEVEKHLAECAACTQLSHRTRETIQLLHIAETLDASDQFMANLHARLDTLGPVPARRTPATVVREWLYEIRQHVNTRPIQTLSVGMASFVLAALLFSGRTGPVVGPPISSTVEKVSQEALDRHVAVTASNPFDDPVAAKLEADTNGADTGSRSSTD
jgi:anti-sigma factor RsiW